jgi:Helix-turn-helix domain
MEHSSSTRSTQRGRILALLIEARGSWVPLPAILELQISQYGARIFELRRMGFVIENKRDGEHSWFRLVTGPVTSAPQAPQPTFSTAGTLRHFGDGQQSALFDCTLAQEHRDDG